jgi:FkbM family methyltransferase
MRWGHDYAAPVLLDLGKLISFYGLAPTGVLHLGAHQGEEASIYAACGIDRVVWVEGNPELIVDLHATLAPYGHSVLEGLLADRAGEPREFYVTNNGMSSSLLPLGTHLTSHPDVQVTHTLNLVTTTVDDLARANDLSGLDFLNIDLQGAELLALRGASDTLAQVDYVYTEVNREAVYVGAAQIEDLDAFLAERGFRRIVTRWTSAQWGDALYVRPQISRARRLLGGLRFRQPLAGVRRRVALVIELARLRLRRARHR